MVCSRFRFPGLSALVVTLLLVVLPTLACQPASQDVAVITSEIPTWDDLGPRRFCKSCVRNPGMSPDGRFVYSLIWDNRSDGEGVITRLDVTAEYSTATWIDVQVVRALDWWQVGRTGASRAPVVSPDGSRLAFSFNIRDPAWRPDNRVFTDRGIRIVAAETGAELQVIRGQFSANQQDDPVAWLPDGRGLVTRSAEGLVSLSLVDETRRLLAPASELAGNAPVSVSPDGRFLAYLGQGANSGEDDIHVAALDGSWRGPVVEASGNQSPPLWTPDGTMLIYADEAELWGVEVVDGRAVGTPRLLVESGRCGGVPIGMGANGTLVFRRSCNQADVYTVEIDPETYELRGEPVSVLGGQGLPNRAATLSPDGTLMAYVKGQRRGIYTYWMPAIWDLTTGTDRTLDTPDADETNGPYMPPTWSPDGRYVLYDLRPGPGERVPGLYLYDMVTGERRWLLDEAVPRETAPSVGAFGWLPDGHTVVYGAATPIDEGQMLSVRRHDVATGHERELWRGPLRTFMTYSSHLSPDGRYITLPQYMGERPEDGQFLLVLDLERGELRELARSPNAYYSLDEPFWQYNLWTRSGTEIIASALDNYDGPGGWTVNSTPLETVFWAIPVAGGDPRKLGSVFIEYGTTGLGSRYFSMHPNSDALTFTGGGASGDEGWVIPDFGQLLDQWKPFAGGSPSQVTHFGSDRLYRFAWSHDGQWLALTRGSTVIDVVLLSVQ